MRQIFPPKQNKTHLLYTHITITTTTIKIIIKIIIVIAADPTEHMTIIRLLIYLNK